MTDSYTQPKIVVAMHDFNKIVVSNYDLSLSRNKVENYTIVGINLNFEWGCLDEYSRSLWPCGYMLEMEWTRGKQKKWVIKRPSKEKKMGKKEEDAHVRLLLFMNSSKHPRLRIEVKIN